MLFVPCWKYTIQIVAKHSPYGHHCTSCPPISSQLRHVSTIKNNFLNGNTSSICAHNMANFGPLTAEIGSGVWETPANFNGFRILAALLHGTLVVGVSQTLRRWTEGATYIRQSNHHVGHRLTFWSVNKSIDISVFMLVLRSHFGEILTLNDSKNVSMKLLVLLGNL